MEADVLLFMGQSNMAGRGDAEKAPEVIPGAAYEYRAVSKPSELVPLKEPFGIEENRLGGVWEPGWKTGSMAAAFVNACYRITGRPIVAVSCSKGGSSIEEWRVEGSYYQDAVKRYEDCVNYLKSQNIGIHSISIVWCQGCTDGDLHTEKEVYKEKTLELFDGFLKLSVERIFLIQIGNQRDEPDLYVPIQEAQAEMAEERENILMISQQFKTFADKGLMKDLFHYKQEAYNLVGEEAGRNAGYILK